MNKQIAVKTREKWVDDIKVIACILVVLGHFFQSMTKASIMPENDLYKWFNTTIYYFHVPLFFICSGYLYQKYSKEDLDKCSTCDMNCVIKVCADKKILWVHNDYDKLDGEDAFFKAYFSKADYVVSISTRCVEILQKVFPDISGKFCMLPNLTSSSFIKKMSGEFIPKEYETDIPVLLSVGRLSRQKGFDYAIDAAALLKKAGYRFKWYVLGIGELQEELETRIQEKEVDDCFKLLGNRENPYPYIKNCTIVVQSSRFEGKSVVLDEAKILAKPIVVTNYATVKDQITDGKEGLVVSMTPKGIADGIEKMLTDSALIQNIKEYLSAHEYGNQEEVQKYMELIEGRE